MISLDYVTAQPGHPEGRCVTCVLITITIWYCKGCLQNSGLVRVGFLIGYFAHVLGTGANVAIGASGNSYPAANSATRLDIKLRPPEFVLYLLKYLLCFPAMSISDYCSAVRPALVGMGI